MDQLLLVALATILGSEASFLLVLFVAIIELELPRIMFLIILALDGHIQFLNHIISIVYARNIRI